MWVGFDRAIKLEFHGATVSSDAGLFRYRDLDEAAQLTDAGAAELFDFRADRNVQHGMTALLCQMDYSRLAGYEEGSADMTVPTAHQSSQQRGAWDVNLSPSPPKQPDGASMPPSWGRTRPVTVDSGQKRATGTWVSGGRRYTRARKARWWSRAKVKWEMSD